VLFCSIEMRTDAVDFLDVRFDRLSFREVQRRLSAVTTETPYGYVVTPNVDHVVRLHREPALRKLYQGADLCLCDSRILRLLARLSGLKLPLVAGSDLAAALLRNVVRPGDKIAIVGATPDFLDRIRSKFPDVEFVQHVPPMGLRNDAEARCKAAAFLASAEARFSFITVGSPQQEMIANEAREVAGAKGVSLCVGAGLEFLTGEQKRAPRLVQRFGLEWAHRLATNPRRLWRRYLVEGPAIFPIYVRWAAQRRRTLWIGGIAALAVMLGLGVIVDKSARSLMQRQQGSAHRGEVAAAPQPLPHNLPPPNLLRPLSPDQATAENAERPFVLRPDSPAVRFVLKTDAADRDRAINCLTQAVYYEAASEGVDGGRAVAQVVLNRLRHPGYPSTVCGVVYEGADRGTGCQFTFVCDGSLQRTPVTALWARSRKIAVEALAGKVFGPVGHATHYHADYVLPYWADMLDKSVQIGRHIFYRLRGPLGDQAGFSQRYGGTEPELPKPPAALVLSDTAATEAANALMSDTVASPPSPVEKAASPVSALAVDQASGTLIIDGSGAAKVQQKAKTASDCSGDDSRSKLNPLAPTELRADQAQAGC
jgi:exopolysaccharide biosynthesis WecB/TagA/CpsF family protein